ncbi:zinc finger protein 839 [Osmerus eperlanus]|uniref:zinc finger protein 839 n=1 Tax=Osmerus eperlanus TaxID=29151 RepID=UPI002E13A368
MADNEDESNTLSTKTEGESCTVSQVQCVSESVVSETPEDEFANQNEVGEKTGERSATVMTVTQGLADFLQGCTKQDDCQVVTQIEGGEQSEQNAMAIDGGSGIATGTEYTAISADFVNAITPATTIIYVQPDGSFVEGSGLTAEEQQQLVEQLAKQQLVQVTDTEAARLFEQNQVVKNIPASSTFVPSTALAPNELQQVIDQVTKSQQQSMVHVNQQTPKATEQVLTTLDPVTGLFTTVTNTEVSTAPSQPLTTVQNASQQLKNVAKHVALQSSNGTRLIQKKPEPIRIQVQMPPKQDLKPLTTTTITIPQQKSLAVAQPQVKVSTNGGMSSPQIIHITPVVGQQQYFLQQNPGEPPIQLLLQSSTPVVGSLVPVVHKLPAPGTPVTIQATSSVQTPLVTVQTTVKTPGRPRANGTPAGSAKPATTPAAQPAVEKQKAKTRVKKPLKVKTRSGRVSRPPKYKAKDYKFIKTEDLAESHQSDSDDYSEISEEEEEGEEGKGSSSTMSYSHKQRAHKCKTCDKAYIGNGGLTRHYRLNPTHGDAQDPPAQNDDPPGKKPETGAANSVKKEEEGNSVPADKLTGSEKDEDTKKTGTTSPATPHKVDPSPALGPAAAAGLRGVQSRGPGRPRGRGRGRGRGRPRGPIPPKVVGLPLRRGRRGRPPKLGGVSTEQLAQRRQERLKEVVHQCENEELLEVVLPRLAKAMSLWDFLLMKVEKGHPAKAHFPEVYGEFEQLHSQVKKMAQEYISNPQGVHTALEVHNMEVAKSLGIFDEVNKLKVLNPGPGQSSTNLATKNVRYMENSKMLPPSKRFKMENRTEEMNSVSIHQNGLEKTANNTKESGLLKVQSGAASSLKTCTVSVSPLVVPSSPKPVAFAAAPPKQPPAPSASATPSTPMPQDNPSSRPAGPGTEEAMDTSDPAQGGQGDLGRAEPCEVLSTSDIADQMKELEKALATDPATDKSEQPQQQQPPGTKPPAPSQTQQSAPSLGRQSQAAPPGGQAVVQEGQEIYIQTEGLTMQLAEGSESDTASERIVIVNGPDGTTMHIRAPEGVPLEAVHALLGIEAEAAKTQQ